MPKNINHKDIVSLSEVQEVVGLKNKCLHRIPMEEFNKKLQEIFSEEFSALGGWSPQMSFELYKDKIIAKIAGFVGGTGSIPSGLSMYIGKYVSNGGYTKDKNRALNFGFTPLHTISGKNLYPFGNEDILFEDEIPLIIGDNNLLYAFSDLNQTLSPYIGSPYTFSFKIKSDKTDFSIMLTTRGERGINLEGLNDDFSIADTETVYKCSGVIGAVGLHDTSLPLIRMYLITPSHDVHVSISDIQLTIGF